MSMTPQDNELPDDVDEVFEEDDASILRRECLLAYIYLHGPLRVATVDLRYVPGDYIAWNGVKGGGPRGYGWDSSGIPSEYHLVATVPGGEIRTRIDRTFKQAIGRLTRKRRAIIRRTMPAEVTLVVGDDPWYGVDELLVSDADLKPWAEQVKALLSAKGKSGRASRAS